MNDDDLLRELERLAHSDATSGRRALAKVTAIPREDSPPPRGIVCEWAGLQFRSKTERCVAQALERANVAFFPNARGRLGSAPDFRENREPDVLVIHGGKVGVLEVDGDSWHPAENAASDHARDRLFKATAFG
jgi:hypothetical protein